MKKIPTGNIENPEELYDGYPLAHYIAQEGYEIPECCDISPTFRFESNITIAFSYARKGF